MSSIHTFVCIDFWFSGGQCMMSERGYDIPVGKSSADQKARQEIFDIIAPYIFSAEDMRIIHDESETGRILWLETFTNTQKGILFTGLNLLAKDEYSTRFFPRGGALPAPDYAKMLGLPPGKTFLSRYIEVFSGILY